MSDAAVANVRAALERSLRPGDAVLVVVDDASADIGAVLVAAARGVGIAPKLMQDRPVPVPNAEPSPKITAALAGADLAVLATSVPISHTQAVRDAVASGTRFLIMDGVSIPMLAGGAAGADYGQIHRLALELEARWNDAAHVRVTSPAGTDFEADISGRRSWRFDGTPFEADWFSITGCAFPDGEVGVAPLEGSGTGVVVWDGSVHGLGLLEEPVRLTVRDGWITEVHGGEQARRYERMLEDLSDRASWYCPAEIAIGINERARLTGTLREDKKALGTVHIASGTNIDIGGTIEARSHVDGLIMKPSLWMDGRQMLHDGRLTGEVGA